jgi:hypothetical protein
VSEPVTEWTGPESGDRRVDRVLASLETVDGLPVAEHVAVFEQAHHALREALADAEDTGDAAGGGNPAGNSPGA